MFEYGTEIEEEKSNEIKKQGRPLEVQQIQKEVAKS